MSHDLALLRAGETIGRIAQLAEDLGEDLGPEERLERICDVIAGYRADAGRVPA